MKFVVLLFVSSVMGSSAACTKPNPATCCLDSADCSAAGFDEIRGCAPGLACVNHECEVPKCSTTGCGAEQPVCNITTDVCEGCTDSTACDRFDATPTCDTSNGVCVECVETVDCMLPTKAICDNQVCRGCQKDSECASGACGEDGACVADGAIVHLDPAGTDAGTCSATSPCHSISFALTQVGPSRNHIVMGVGGYSHVPTLINAQNTNASHLYIHGGGATLSLSGESSMLDISIGVTIRELNFEVGGGSGALRFFGPDLSTVESVRIRQGFNGVLAMGAVLLRDVVIEDCANGVSINGGQLSIERAIIRRGETGVLASSTTVHLTNLLVYGTSNLALDLRAANGIVEFTTVANSGADSGTGPRAVFCGPSTTLRSSIVWVPGVSTRPPFQDCNVVSSIAGPNNGPGATNADPKFVDAANGDYHIGSNSPARDAVDMGPPFDFEGDARPRGAKFDIGADEAL